MSAHRPRLALFCIVLSGVFALGWQSRSAASERADSGPLALPTDLQDIRATRGQVFSYEHLVTTPDGAELHILEKFTLRSVFTKPRRAILMLTPTFVTNGIYDATIEGDASYNALERMAKQGFFAFAVTYEGYGQSSFPEDGREVTFEKSLAQAGHLLELIRSARRVSKVDVLGGSMGAGLAVALGSVGGPVPLGHVGKIVLTSFVYEEFSPFVQENVFTPELQALLESLPYLETTPDMYGMVLSAAEPQVLDWAIASFPGVYATGPTLEGFYLPTSPAEDGRAPALHIWGDADIMNTLNDVNAFQADYGGTVDLVIVPGAAHSPLLEPTRDIVFEEIITFLNEGDEHDE